MARIPGFHPGYPGPIPEQGTKISLQATSHYCCLSEITMKENGSMLLDNLNRRKYIYVWGFPEEVVFKLKLKDG